MDGNIRKENLLGIPARNDHPPGTSGLFHSGKSMTNKELYSLITCLSEITISTEYLSVYLWFHEEKCLHNSHTGAAISKTPIC